MRRPLVVLACTAALAGTAIVAIAAPAPGKAPAFGKPVLLTTDKYTGGY
jgi:hypothetical protein